MSKTCLKLVLACAAVAGCATNPATWVMSNGQPLRVRYSSGTGTYVSDDVVGTDVQRDSQLSRTELASVMRLICSQLDLSLPRLLR